MKKKIAPKLPSELLRNVTSDHQDNYDGGLVSRKRARPIVVKAAERKLKRKKKRVEKKQRNNKQFQQQQEKLKLEAEQRKEIRRQLKQKEQAAEAAAMAREARNRKPSNFEKLVASQNLIKGTAAPDEDMELEYLERKLGIHSKKSNKNKNKSWKKLGKEFEQDGFSSELAGFLQSLDGVADDEEDHSQDENESDDDQVYSGEESLFDDDEVEGEEEEDETSDEDSDENDDDDEEAREEIENGQKAIYLPKADLYGKESSDSGERTRPKFFTKSDKRDSSYLRRRMNGLLNRLSNDNLLPILGDFELLYKEYSQREANAILSEVILSSISNDQQVLMPVLLLYGGLIAGLNITVGTDVGAHMVEQTVLSFDKHHTDLLHEDFDDFHMIPKKCTNLSMLLCILYIYNVVNSILLFDIIEKLCQQLTVANIELLNCILDEIGSRLKADNPSLLKAAIVAVQAGTNTAAKDEENQGRIDFLLTNIYDLKNNKQNARSKHEASLGRSNKLRKMLRSLQDSKSAVVLPLQVKYSDYLNANENGRWWIVGSVWKQQEVSKSNNAAQQMVKQDPISLVLNSASPQLRRIAVKHRMNTDIRKALFYVIMTSSDYVECFDRVLGLGLKDRQERDIIHVLVHCCRVSKHYNDYYHLIANRLCDYHHKHKFTVQLAYWDIFKQLDSIKPKHLLNLVQLLVQLLLSYSLSLSMLKVVDFTALSKGSHFFFTSLLVQLLTYRDESNLKQSSKAMMQVFYRLGSSKDFDSIKNNLLFFLQNNDLQKYSKLDATTTELLKKRIKLLKKVLDEADKKREQQLQNQNKHEEDMFA